MNWHDLATPLQRTLWYDITANELALLSNTLYHKLHTGSFGTLLIFVEKIHFQKYALVAITSRYKLTRQSVIDAINEIPQEKKKADWRNGR